jgi:hypothetical protein
MMQKYFIIFMLIVVGAILLSNVILGALRRIFGKGPDR